MALFTFSLELNFPPRNAFWEMGRYRPNRPRPASRGGRPSQPSHLAPNDLGELVPVIPGDGRPKGVHKGLELFKHAQLYNI